MRFVPSRRVAALAPVVLVASLVGCATPSVDVHSATIEQSSPDSVRLGVDLELTNPASDPMRLLQWRYTFRSGSASYTGTWEALAVLPPERAPVVLRIPCVVPLAQFDPNSPWSVSGTLTYRSPSRIAEIVYDLGIWRPSTGFSGGTASVTTSQPNQAAPIPTTTAAGASASDSGTG